ncbi:MAG: hypothetical protein ACRC1J_03610, partial [Sandaracinobacteroides sp.]
MRVGAAETSPAAAVCQEKAGPEPVAPLALAGAAGAGCAEVLKKEVGMFNEFKAFISRGNVLDLAV